MPDRFLKPVKMLTQLDDKSSRQQGIHTIPDLLFFQTAFK